MFDALPHDAMPRPKMTPFMPTPLQQSPEFARALMATGQSPLVLPQLDNTLVLKTSVWGLASVAMVNRSNFRKPQRLLEILQEEGVSRTPVILSPNRPLPELARLGAVPLFSPAHVALLPLDAEMDVLHSRLHQKWRNRLSHATGQGLRVTRQNMPDDPAHWLLRADADQSRARGYRGWPRALTCAYARENKGCAKLFQAFEGRDVVAGILVLRHGTSATYHVAHSTDRGKHSSAHNLLMWEVMRWLVSKDVQHLDLGLINTEDAAGLARFKLGTGAGLHPLGGTWVFWPPARRLMRPLALLDRRLMGA